MLTRSDDTLRSLAVCAACWLFFPARVMADPSCPAATVANAGRLRDEIGALTAGPSWQQAIPRLRCLVQIADVVFGPGHATSANLRVQLAQLLNRAGQRSDEIRAPEMVGAGRLGEPEDATRSAIIRHMNEGRVALDNANLAQAERKCKDARSGLEGAQLEHTVLGSAVMNECGRVAEARQRFVIAEDLYRASEKIARALGESGRGRLSIALNNLGVLHRRLDRPAEALKDLEESLALSDPTDPERLTAMSTIASLESEFGRFQDSLELRMKARALAQANYLPNHPYLVEITNGLASTHWRAGNVAEALRWQQEANELANNNLLTGLGLDRKESWLEYAQTFQKETDATLSLVFLNLKSAPTAARVGLDTILARKGRVLDALVQRSRTKPAQPAQPAIARVSLEAVREALPSRSVLLEFTSYARIKPKLKSAAYDVESLRYAVGVLSDAGKVTFKDLGPRAEIDSLISDLLDRFATPSADPSRLSRALYAKVLAPIESLFQGAKRIFIAGDGELNRVPFAALRDRKDRYLLDLHAFTYVSSGRSLASPQASREPLTDPVVVGMPDYGPPKEGGRCTNWPSFEQDESSAVATLLKTQATTGPKATESFVKAMRHPRIVHLSVHGFFDRQCTAAAEGDLPVAQRALYRSGLVLAGANQRASADADGILTAAEVAALDLRGTELVVMSACESGLGNVVDGEGVFGLRRTLEIAGARRQVMSLWQIPVNATADITLSFHRLLAQGEEPAVALGKAQRSLRDLPSKAFASPYYWAAFIASGDYRPLASRDDKAQAPDTTSSSISSQ